MASFFQQQYVFAIDRSVGLKLWLDFAGVFEFYKNRRDNSERVSSILEAYAYLSAQMEKIRFNVETVNDCSQNQGKLYFALPVPEADPFFGSYDLVKRLGFMRREEASSGTPFLQLTWNLAKEMDFIRHIGITLTSASLPHPYYGDKREVCAIYNLSLLSLSVVDNLGETTIEIPDKNNQKKLSSITRGDAKRAKDLW